MSDSPGWKVEICVLARDGNAGRKAGAIIHMKEGRMLDEITWGTAMGPPGFRIIRIINKKISDLPKEMTEYGCHRSRVLLNFKDYKQADQDALLANKVAPVSWTDVNKEKTDQGTNWNPTAEVVEP